MSMTAYVDDSKVPGSVLVMAGYLAPTESWARFSNEWQSKIDELKLEEYKYSAAPSLPDEFQGYLYKSIEAHIVASVGCILPLATLSSVVDELFLPEFLKDDPYIIGYRGAIEICERAAAELAIDGPLEYVFDQQENMVRGMNLSWDMHLSQFPDGEKHRAGARPQFANSMLVKPLQTADMLAGWYRSNWVREGAPGVKALGFPWLPKKNYLMMLRVIDEDFIRNVLLKLRADAYGIHRVTRISYSQRVS